MYFGLDANTKPKLHIMHDMTRSFYSYLLEITSAQPSLRGSWITLRQASADVLVYTTIKSFMRQREGKKNKRSPFLGNARLW